MKGNHARIVMGFSMLCCVNVICFFPDALAPWASTEWLRTYNTYARPAECLSLVAIAVFAFKVPRRIGMVGVAIGYVGLLCGLCAPAILGSNVETSVLAGILCGIGACPHYDVLVCLPDRIHGTSPSHRPRMASPGGRMPFSGRFHFLRRGCHSRMHPDCGISNMRLARRFKQAFFGKRKNGCFNKKLAKPRKNRLARPLHRIPNRLPCLRRAYGSLSRRRRRNGIGNSFRHRRPHRSSLLHRLGDSQQAPRLRSRLRMGRGGIRRRMPTARQCDRAIFFRLFPNNGPFALFVIHRPSFSHAARSHSVHSERLRNIAFAVFLRPLPPRRPWSYKRQRHCGARSSMDLACAIGSTAFIVRTWRTNATHIELENRCRSYERIIEEQQSEIKKHDEESALLRAAAFGGGSEREYSIACELIAKKHGLTKRETEILSLLARGRDVSFICNELYLARNTVKGYTKRIYAKMDIHSKQEAIDMVLSAMSRQQHATPANQGEVHH